MKKTPIQTNLPVFPAQIQPLLANCTLYDSSCSAQAAVYYADTGYYIKTAACNALAHEATMGRLFSQMGLGVDVVNYISADKDYLVTRSAPGEDLTHLLHDPERICRILAESLRTLHTQPVQALPRSPKYRIYEQIAAGTCPQDPWTGSALLDRFGIHSFAQAWEIIQTNKNRLTRDTLIHGDACLPNVVHDNGRFSSFLDFTLAGMGDRHIDLYWAIWSLQFNLKTDAYTDRFLDLYGREDIQEDMLGVIAALELFD